MKPKVKAPVDIAVQKTAETIRLYGVNTVCYASKCPNLGECFERGTATFMLLGNICTRNCKFCNIPSGKPAEPDEDEPKKTAEAVKKLKLRYAVITSVDRDDLQDFGSGHFAKTAYWIKKLNPETKTEALTPDFKGEISALNTLVSSLFDKLAHNIETIERLHKKLKPQSSYKLSLSVLEYYSKYKPTKSSLIIGFGETVKEIEKTLKDLANAGVSQLTIGQYLRPSKKHFPVKKFYTKKEFDMLKNIAFEAGFESVVSGTLVRSSYYAEKM
ncbi:lipoyl synthase [Nautilia sp.]